MRCQILLYLKGTYGYEQMVEVFVYGYYNPESSSDSELAISILRANWDLSEKPFSFEYATEYNSPWPFYAGHWRSTWIEWCVPWPIYGGETQVLTQRHLHSRHLRGEDLHDSHKLTCYSDCMLALDFMPQHICVFRDTL